MPPRPKQVFLLLKPRTAKMLKVWCALNGLTEAGTATACIGESLRLMADERGAAFSKTFEEAFQHRLTKKFFSERERVVSTTDAPDADTPAENEILPSIEEVREHFPESDSAATVRVNFRLRYDAAIKLEVFAAHTGLSKSAVADEAISRHVMKLAGGRDDFFWNAFAAAVVACSWVCDAKADKG